MGRSRLVEIQRFADQSADSDVRLIWSIAVNEQRPIPVAWAAALWSVIVANRRDRAAIVNWMYQLSRDTPPPKPADLYLDPDLTLCWYQITPMSIGATPDQRVSRVAFSVGATLGQRMPRVTLANSVLFDDGDGWHLHGYQSPERYAERSVRDDLHAATMERDALRLEVDRLRKAMGYAKHFALMIVNEPGSELTAERVRESLRLIR